MVQEESLMSNPLLQDSRLFQIVATFSAGCHRTEEPLPETTLGWAAIDELLEIYLNDPPPAKLRKLLRTIKTTTERKRNVLIHQLFEVAAGPRENLTESAADLIVRIGLPALSEIAAVLKERTSEGRRKEVATRLFHRIAPECFVNGPLAVTGVGPNEKQSLGHAR